jgi:hypothetical protein
VRRAALALAALALTGCASSRLPAESPDGAALDVALLVRQSAADTAGAVAGGATPKRVQAIWGDAIEAEDEAHRIVPSTTAAKAPLLAAAAATTQAAQALGLHAPADARSRLVAAQAQLGRVADAVEPRLPERAQTVERLREPLS